MFELLSYERFRDTPSVRFFDVTVDTSNARDLVIHSGPAVSPPNDPESGAWQFYLHPHQEDNLLAASGGRTFFLVNLAWKQPFHIVRLESGGDILRIPPGTFHRSISDPDGSVVLNQAVREEGVSLVHEFRVYNSARIPALMAVTDVSAPNLGCMASSHCFRLLEQAPGVGLRWDRWSPGWTTRADCRLQPAH